MGKAENDEGAGGWSSDKWVECYDPIVEETYYYCHATKESTYDPPDDYITANEDPIIKSVIKIQCLGRKVSCPPGASLCAGRIAAECWIHVIGGSAWPSIRCSV